MTSFTAMNTSFLLAGLSDTDSESVKKLIVQAEQAFSRFREDSEVSIINRNKGHWVQVSPLAYRLLEDVWQAYQHTTGIFNPFLRSTLEQLGYNQSFELLPQNFPSDKVEQSRYSIPSVITGKECTPYLEFDEKKSSVRLGSGAELDLGGIAKGWIAQYAAEQCIVRGTGHGLIDAGGDIVLWGKEPQQEVWGVEVAHPLQADGVIADLWLEGLTAMATSNIIKRSWSGPSGKRAHHIIDPRTGQPAESDLVQATVLTRDVTLSEQYAKGLLVLGSEEGIPWLADHCPAAAYIALRTDGTIVTGGNLDLYCTEWEVFHHEHS